MTEPIPEPWFPVLTSRLLLRPARPDDYEAIHDYASDPEVARYMEWGPNTAEETRLHLDRLISETAIWPRASTTLVAEVATEAWVIGTIRLALQHAVNRTFDFGYSFHRDAWGQGFATEAARALVDIAFRDLGAHRVFATCDPRNVGSWRVMEKLGMRREGCLIRARARRDGWQDELVYGLLEDEWRASAPA